MPQSWRGDPELKERPSPPEEWTVWNISQAYSCTPAEAWANLGRPELSPRQLRRLTLASAELASLDHAWDDMTATHAKGRGPNPESMLRVAEAEALYNAAEQPTWDAIAEELERELAARGELAEGEHVAPYTGEGLVETPDGAPAGETGVV